ncbi:TPA: MazG-like family protein [Streptococcus suis]|nr:MazG-like family protein [Streptococcus suis]
MTITDLIENVKDWSAAKGLDKSDARKQMLKLFEEFGELNAGIAKNNTTLIKDSIGDVMVVLTILCQQLNLDAREIFLTADSLTIHHPKTLEIEVLSLITGALIGKLSTAILNRTNRTHGIKSNLIIREIVLKLHFISKYYDFTKEQCFETAWNEIKDRTGKMVDGVFVKAADLEEGQ